MSSEHPSLSCPVCGAPLQKRSTAFCCENRHDFDIARQGYVNLLQPGHSSATGDDREMVAARTAFLESGTYAPFSDAVNRLCLCALSDLSCPAVIADAGCGEGYYTARLAKAFANAGHPARFFGLDLSKYACAHGAAAAKAERLPIQYAVCSLFHMPLFTASCDLLLNLFAPSAPEEFARIVRPGGFLCFAAPAADHLMELKALLYEQPYENKERIPVFPGFALRQTERVRFSFSLYEHRMALFRMTPYYFRTPRSGAQRLEALEAPMRVTGAVNVLLYERLAKEISATKTERTEHYEI